METNPLPFSKNHLFKILLAAGLTLNLSPTLTLQAQVNQQKQERKLSDFTGTYQFTRDKNMLISIRESNWLCIPK